MIYRILWREEGPQDDHWKVLKKVRRDVPRYYSTKGAAKGAASLLTGENDWRERRGYPRIEYVVEQAQVLEWERV